MSVLPRRDMLHGIATRLLRAHAPRIHDGLVRVGASPAFHFCRNLPDLPRNEWLLYRNRPYLPVDLADRMGLGAYLNKVVQILHYADRERLRPILRFSNPLYSPTGDTGTDWLPLLFDRVVAGDEPHIRSRRFIRRYWYLERHLDDPSSEVPIDVSHALIASCLRVRTDVMQGVDDFCRSSGVDGTTLAIHYRGTDKYFEARRVSAERAIHAVSLHAGRYRKIFVATDEPEFLATMRSRFAGERICDMGCTWIYPNSQPAHLMPGNGPEKAREALMTMLVLARCGLCIRTPSNLSRWAQIFHPDLPTILLD